MIPENSKEELRKQLIIYLKEMKLSGLPKNWFNKQETERKICKEDNLPQQLNILNENKTDIDEELSQNKMKLEELKTKALSCERCRLAQTRQNVVFGAGNTSKPLICFVGEGPGADEDREGEPFVGRAGKLLTAAIEKGLGLKREDVYICNVVKCRPPENRTPLPDEVEQCSFFLFNQLELIKPQVIVTLGQPAQLALCGIKTGITKLHGQWQNWRGIKLMPTFHPAYILRNPSVKPLFWEDLKAVMREVML